MVSLISRLVRRSVWRAVTAVLHDTVMEGFAETMPAGKPMRSMRVMRMEVQLAHVVAGQNAQARERLMRDDQMRLAAQAFFDNFLLRF
jgi:hypothetical protein